MATIEVKNLVKFYGKNKGLPPSLDNISFKVEQGEIFGIVGPDGAGKTTLLRILTGILKKTTGEVWIMNLNIDKDYEKIKYHTGYMSQKFNLYPTLTVEENIRFFAGIFGVSREEYNTQGKHLLELTGLSNFTSRQARDLSGGMKQKLALVATLIHKPDVLILDEATLGVDPVSRRDFWQILQEFSRQGTTIIISTSYMDEAELCNKVILLFEGKIVLEGNPVELKKIDSIVLELSSADGVSISENILETMKPLVDDVYTKGTKTKVILPKNKKEAFIKEYKKLFHINEVSASIEDVFVKKLGI